jgi:hypothetical protein
MCPPGDAYAAEADAWLRPAVGMPRADAEACAARMFLRRTLHAQDVTAYAVPKHAHVSELVLAFVDGRLDRHYFRS